MEVKTTLELIKQNLIDLIGILLVITELSEGNKGFKINSLKGLTNKFEYFFGEDQARYIVEVPKDKIQKVVEILNNSSVHYDDLGVIVDKNERVNRGRLLFFFSVNSCMTFSKFT